MERRVKFIIIIANLILLCLVLAFFASSCGRRKTSVKEGKVEIRYENWEVLPAQIKAHSEVAKRFNEIQKEIVINYQPVHGGTQKIIVEMAGGTAPDVFYWCDTILPVLVEKKAAIDLMPFIREDNFSLEQYFPPVLQALSYDSKIYGLPIYFGTSALVYNKSLFDKEKIAYPGEDWTWQDFLEAAKKLTKRQKGRTLQFGALMPHYHLVIMSFGGDFFNRDFSRCILDSPEAKQALQFLLDLQNKYKVVPSQAESGGVAGGFKTGLEMFMTGRVAMFVTGSAMLGTLDGIKSFKWDVAPIPRRKGRKRISGFATGILCISNQCKHPKEAWKFVKFACGEEGTSIIGKARNCIPAVKKAAYSVFSIPPPEHIRVFVDTINYGTPVGKITWADEFVSLVVQPEMDLLFLNKQTIEETIAKIGDRAEEYVKIGELK